MNHPTLLLLPLMAALSGQAQTADTWNHKQCAVVLTYDDAIDVDLDNVVPALDSMGFKATFYLIGSSPTLQKRMAEWKTVAGHGHELGNHSLFHPCDGSLPGRNSWIKPDRDLSKYTIGRAVEEIRATNTLLYAIDGKTTRTFAYPCGELNIRDSAFYPGLKNDFAGARGVRSKMEEMGKVDLDNIGAYGMNGQSGQQMIDLVKEAIQQHTLLVFLFHGVGGGHPINVGSGDHSQLLHYLKDHESEIWIAPMVDVAEYIKVRQKK
jgi:sialate O-acetylesterase